MKIGLILALLPLPISLAFVSVGMGQLIIKDLKPGPVTIDLGNGYQVSSSLADLKRGYDTETSEPSTFLELKHTRHLSMVLTLMKH